jgi:hypothetical protein
VCCLVKISHPEGGNDEYLIEKPTGLFDAVRRALAIHEERLARWSDDTVVTVIEDGQRSIYWDHAEHNQRSGLEREGGQSS